MGELVECCQCVYFAVNFYIMFNLGKFLFFVALALPFIGYVEALNDDPPDCYWSPDEAKCHGEEPCDTCTYTCTQDYKCKEISHYFKDVGKDQKCKRTTCSGRSCKVVKSPVPKCQVEYCCVQLGNHTTALVSRGGMGLEISEDCRQRDDTGDTQCLTKTCDENVCVL